MQPELQPVPGADAELAGRHALVTGAGSGIGLATARGLLLGRACDTAILAAWPVMLGCHVMHDTDLEQRFPAQVHEVGADAVLALADAPPRVHRPLSPLQ